MSLNQASNPFFKSNLPSSAIKFVGRAGNVTSIIQAYTKDGAARLVIWGAGGLGKTELAKVAAHSYIGDAKNTCCLWASASPDEVEFKVRDLSSLLYVFDRVFGLNITAQKTTDEQKALVRTFLESHPTLIVLDNCEAIEEHHMKELWAFLVSLPSSTRLLATSRHAMPPKDVRNIEIDLLPPTSSIEMFNNILMNTGYFDRNPQARTAERAIIERICEQLGGYPFALEVTAGQTVSLTLTQVWAELQATPKAVLEGQDELTDEPRGMWTSLDRSYKVLSEDEKKLFREMSVLLAPTSLDDTCGIITVENAGPLLSRLVKRSLVKMYDSNYMLLPVVRDYAKSKLVENGEQIRELHFRAYRQYISDSVERLFLASDHLYAVAEEFNDEGAALAFWGLMQVLDYALNAPAHRIEARRKMRQFVLVAQILKNRELERNLLFSLSSGYVSSGDYEYAAEQLTKLLTLSEEMQERSMQEYALQTLGVMRERQKRYDESKAFYKRAYDLHEKDGDEQSCAMVSCHLANIEFLTKNYKQAERIYRQNMKIFQRGGNEHGKHFVYHQLGMIAWHQKLYDKSHRLLNSSLKIARKLDDKRGEATSLYEKAQAFASEGKFKDAEDLAQQSLTLIKEVGDGYGITLASNLLARLKQRSDDYAGAAVMFRQSFEFAQKVGNNQHTLEQMFQVAFMEYAQNNYIEAEQQLQECLSVAEEGKQHLIQSNTLILLGKIKSLEKKYKQSFFYFIKAIAVLTSNQWQEEERYKFTLQEVGAIVQEVGNEQILLWINEVYETDKELVKTWVDVIEYENKQRAAKPQQL